MATVKQEMSTNVKFGGTIDPSWTKSLGSMERGLGELAKESSRLVSQQIKLKEKMRLATLKGKNGEVAKLKKEYEKLGNSIKETAKAEDHLAKRAESRRRREKFTGAAKGVAKGTAMGAMKGGLWGGAGLIAGTAGLIAMNAHTAEQAGMAKSYGVGIETFKAWEGMGKRMGLNGENFGDLAEELSNKMGEYKKLGKMSAVTDSMGMIGLGEGSLKGLSNEQQMAKILDAAMKMKDGQAAASAIDMLMGGEGNKILTYMRATGKTYQELMESQKRLNMVTQEGADGAVKGNYALDSLWTVVSTAAQEITGSVLGEFAPKMQSAAEGLADWFKKGGGLKTIEGYIKETLIPGAIKIGEGFMLVGEVAFALAKKLDWVLPDEMADKTDILRSIAEGDIEGAKSAAAESGNTEFLDKILSDSMMVNRLKSEFNDKRTDVNKEHILHPQKYIDDALAAVVGMDKMQEGSISEKLKSWSSKKLEPQAAPPNSINADIAAKSEMGINTPPNLGELIGQYNSGDRKPKKVIPPQVTQTITIYQQPGESSESLAGRVGKEVSAPFSMYDSPELE